MTGDVRSKPQDGAPGMSLALIAKRNLDPPLESWTPESLSEALRALHTVRLDREKLDAIENLEGLEAIHSLYLQQNQIKTIAHLAHLWNLRFLTLAGNQIRKLENLSMLRVLHFLDLSDNQIETLDAGELPQSLRVLYLKGNPCAAKKDYRETVLRALPPLRELDGEPITGHQELEPEDEDTGESESESSDEELECLRPLQTNKGFFLAVHQELAGRSERRRKNALQEHEARIEEALGLPSLLWAPGLSTSTAETGQLAEKAALQRLGGKPLDFKAPGDSKEPRSKLNAVSVPTNHAITKASSAKEGPRKASPSLTVGPEKVPAAVSKGRNSASPAPERASSSPAKGKGLFPPTRTPVSRPVPSQAATRGAK